MSDVSVMLHPVIATAQNLFDSSFKKKKFSYKTLKWQQESPEGKSELILQFFKYLFNL